MIKAIEERRSIRKYKNIPVEKEKIQEIIESGRISPSGSNTQPWHFIIVESDEMRNKVSYACHNQKWMVQAPVFIVCVADIRSRLDEGHMSINEESC